MLNTWEAVYFDHSLERLEPLIAAASRVGVERFVLDDGWFTGRRDDRRALGDWTVDPAVWPDGLHPLAARLAEAGLEFGLWVEPEMISADSDLARAHPDWLLGRPDALEWRFQRVLDLGIPEAAEHVFARLSALLDEYPIAYLKWDHNRDLLEGSSHRQTTAVYALIDRLRREHPGVEIESCASGGARIDLGMLRRVDRVWPSDTNDPLDRQGIFAATSLLVPPEYLGAHLGDAVAHLTGRSSDLSFRMATALFGSAGIEWNLAEAEGDDLDAIAAWIAALPAPAPAAAQRPGRAGRCGRSRAAGARRGRARSHARGVLGRDARSAGIGHRAARAAAGARARRRRIASSRSCSAAVRGRWRMPRRPGTPQGHAVLTGAVLAELGLPLPLLAPQQALVLEVTAL